METETQQKEEFVCKLGLKLITCKECLFDTLCNEDVKEENKKRLDD